MLITYNKKTTNPADVRSVDLFKSLSAIKDGKFKSEVSKVRVETNKERRGVLKNLLSGFVFSGTFSYRSKTKLKQSSGLAMLDFDEVQDLDELRSQFYNQFNIGQFFSYL